MIVNLPLRQVINGDCLEVMQALPDKSVDLCLTDVPYGIDIMEMGISNSGGQYTGLAKSTNFTKYANADNWDAQSADGWRLFHILRVSKNQIIFGGNYIADKLPVTRCWIVWDKRTAEKFDGRDQADCEIAWTSFDKPSRIIRYLWLGMLQGDMANKEERYHPTQKPLPIIEKILSNYSKEGDVILDPFLGSGTTAVACEKLRRKWIGIEINKDYCEIARKRLEPWMNQSRLDAPIGVTVF